MKLENMFGHLRRSRLVNPSSTVQMPSLINTPLQRGDRTDEGASTASAVFRKGGKPLKRLRLRSPSPSTSHEQHLKASSDDGVPPAITIPLLLRLILLLAIG